MPIATLVAAAALASSFSSGDLDRKVSQLAQEGRFSGVVLVAQGGKPVYSRAEGLRNAAEGTKVDLDTKFNLGSMNKMFTAVAIAQLEEKGLLAYGDKLGKYLPDYPDAPVREVTLHQLLTHTSGLGSYFNDKFHASKDTLRTVRDHFPLFTGEPLEFPPGTKWSYSNVGFILLGAVIEKVSGEDYEHYVHQHVFAPAGMKDTAAYEKNAIVPNLAVGYTRLCVPGVEQVTGDSPLCTNVTHLPYRGSAAGGGYSTAKDLLRFATALREGKLLKPASVQTLTTGKVAMRAPPGIEARYAYGFGDVRRGGLHSFGHNGGAPGISSALSIYPELDAVVVVMTNHDPQEGGVEQVQRTVERLLQPAPSAATAR